MTAHDPLCACYPNLTGAPCHCHLIAKVRADERSKWDGSTVVLASEVTKMLDAARADEREQAAQRVVDLYLASHEMYSRPPVCAEVLDTIREEQP